MDLGAIFLLLGVLVIVGVFVAQPFTTHWRARAQRSQEMSALLAERERTLTALLELDADNAIGKIPGKEYSSQRASLVRKGADILRRLDEIQNPQQAPVRATAIPIVANVTTNMPSDDDLEDLISKRRNSRQKKTAGFCPSCGKPILVSDQFCPSCGHKLNSK
jgi:zinc-ribbon domain